MSNRRLQSASAEPAKAWHKSGRIHIELDDGRELSFPVKGNRRLEGATHKALNNIELTYDGLHWPDLDEDLGIEGILRGDHGQEKPRNQKAARGRSAVLR
jgi:hypothetical protein